MAILRRESELVDKSGDRPVAAGSRQWGAVGV